MWMFLPKNMIRNTMYSQHLRDCNSIVGLIEMMEASKKMQFKGQIVFKNIQNKSDIPFGTIKYLTDDNCLYVSYNNVSELKEFIGLTNFDRDNNIIRIVIYDYGSYIKYK